jgi:hypothetical protein
MTSNITSGFIDIATWDTMETNMYGGEDCITYFVRNTQKCTWFTQVPVLLTRANGSPGFGQDWAVGVSRAGDYLLYIWLRVTLPKVTLLQTNKFSDNGAIRWTRNLMHNLCQEVTFTFNDLKAAQLDSYFLDFWHAFTCPEGKKEGYDHMVGNVDELINPHGPNDPLEPLTLNLPLPFFFARDTGVALPTCAIPFNEMHVNFRFRPWEQLLMLDKANEPSLTQHPVVGVDIAYEPKLTLIQVWGNYALVNNDERKLMGNTQRDILIEQVQTAPKTEFNPRNAPNMTQDIRFSHPVKVLFFGVRNKTRPNEWSNYAAASPVVYKNAQNKFEIDFTTPWMWDPISQAGLTYENTSRLSDMGSDFFSLVQPWYHSPSIPSHPGYHMYSYSLAFGDVDVKGSTNYGKLSNVSVSTVASYHAIEASNGRGVDWTSGASFNQNYEMIFLVVANNILRVCHGAVGFPVL